MQKWGLLENSRLAKYMEDHLQFTEHYKSEELPPEFIAQQIVPEQTAYFIIGIYQKYLNGEILDGEKHMQTVKQWMKAGTPPHGKELIFLQCKAGVEVQGEIEGDSETQPKVVHYGRCKSNNKLWAFERGKGWYLPDAELSKKINERFSILPQLAKPVKKKPVIE